MTEYPRRPRDSRRTGARILDTAEGVLVTLRRYRVDQAFVELMQTAKRHDVNPVNLADALVAIAEDQLSEDLDHAAAAVALATWGNLFTVSERDSAPAPRLHDLHDLPAENA
ncbi:ANTAR domain-containing protein (plasmid) [Mycobacterium europaeum]|uniref:ANTAR domain-containing protein n=1 Tax=Mycobacterium TaxID=1763 RepID=UPI00080B157F|nr:MULTISPECIES: ANTAR domain-containing protein [Mycobacterium]AOS95133.1 hypothetical protein AN480_29245 [Mycobacterium intracellulare subsp. chimaera]MCA2322821.1 ANTAR domain-containing protein [Mycobacterium intracellulare]MCA2343326.1 ANTAR domain-containing protein [Mycobacterium intracellulare]MEA1163113.1 ANTAR domain-containing protein [Mycobacterium europaeum]OCB51351.1 hypothetical protein A9X02_11425 [Mycobacterium malmoense]